MTIHNDAQRRIAIPIEATKPYRHHIDPLAGIHRYAREHTNWVTVVDPNATDIRDKRFDGVVGRITPEIVSACKFAGVPTVNIWTDCQDNCAAHVFPDCVTDGRWAAEYLMERGHRRFALLEIETSRGARWTGDAFREVIAAKGYPLLSTNIRLNYDTSPRNWRRFLEQLSDFVDQFVPPVAVFVPGDHPCRQLVNVCLQYGLSIPQDVAVLGCGDNKLICLQLEPELSSVEGNLQQVGYEAAALLDRMMKGSPAPKEPIFIKPVGVVTRRSTDIHVMDDPLVRNALSYINKRIGEAIRVSEVATHLSTTVRTLDRRFVQAIGRTVTDEIARLRLERSKRMLLETKVSIKTVARDCGYSEPAYFSQVFHKAVGATPSEFRQQRPLSS